MSTVVEQGRCINKRCGSHDAGTWYADGSYHCFSCGYHIPPNGIVTYRSRQKIQENQVNLITLPDDTVSFIPQEPLDWLNKYGLSLEEVSNFGWSSNEEKLIYPVYVDKQVIFYWSRYFPQREPKNFNSGSLENNPHILTSNGKYDTIYLVEDIVSAIKVNRTSDVLCLFGSNMRDSWLHKLRTRGYKRVCVWLDYDKRINSIKLSSRLKTLFPNGAESVITELDPKDHIK